MDLETIEKLIEKMEKHKITRLCLKEESGFLVELERKNETSEILYQEKKIGRESAREFQQEREKPKEECREEEKQTNHFDITSPMVGTFYALPSPDDPPFVKKGNRVNEDTIVCIIEAMKVMNEVKAGKKGKITEVYVENGCSVEFGTKLFCIEV